MIASEEGNSVKFKELWTMGERERERKERCWMGHFGPRRPLADPMREEQGRGYTGSVTVLCGGGESAVQTRQVQEAAQSSESPSLLSGHINAGDIMTISVDNIADVSESKLLALTRWFLLELGRPRGHGWCGQ